MKRQAPRIVWLVLATIIVGVSAAWLLTRHEARYETLEGEIFSTHYRIIYHADRSLALSPRQIQSAIDQELDRIDWIASTWKDESELSRYNRAADKSAFPLSADLGLLLQHSRDIEKRTDGAFNVEYKEGFIDLSGIAKGYAVDRIADYLGSTLAIDSFLINIGGEVKARGVNAKGEPWRVGIFVPPEYPSISPPRIELRNQAIGTSGSYFKGNHIFDPVTQEAVINPLLSASVIAPTSTTADALATALYVMGLEKGMDWARRHQIHAIFILEDGRIFEVGDRDGQSN